MPSKLAGGDLDGDVYLLLTEASGLVPADDCIVEPAAYDAAPVVKLDRPVEVKDGADFFFQCETFSVSSRILELQTPLTSRLASRRLDIRSDWRGCDPPIAPR